MTQIPARRLTLATDGSCLGNPGPGGWAWAVSPDVWMAGAHQLTTNNLMELRAVFEALSAVPPHLPLLIQADSQYVINVFTRWLPEWKERGWRTAARKPVANREAIEGTAAFLQGRDVRWEHVYGHRGHVMNEEADKRARAAAEAMKMGKRVETTSVVSLSDYLARREV